MARFTIQIIHPDTHAQPDVPGQRLTVNIPEPPRQLTNWQDVLNWLRDDPHAPFAIHGAILALLNTFSLFPKPE